MWYKDKKRAMKSEVIKQAGGKDATKESILEVLFSENCSNEFYVYWWENPWRKPKAWWQRLNLLWMTPVFVLFVAPIQWLIKGEAGFDQRTKVGEVILKLIGEK